MNKYFVVSILWCLSLVLVWNFEIYSNASEVVQNNKGGSNLSIGGANNSHDYLDLRRIQIPPKNTLARTPLEIVESILKTHDSKRFYMMKGLEECSDEELMELIRFLSKEGSRVQDAAIILGKRSPEKFFMLISEIPESEFFYKYHVTGDLLGYFIDKDPAFTVELMKKYNLWHYDYHSSKYNTIEFYSMLKEVTDLATVIDLIGSSKAPDEEEEHFAYFAYRRLPLQFASEVLKDPEERLAYLELQRLSGKSIDNAILSLPASDAFEWIKDSGAVVDDEVLKNLRGNWINQDPEVASKWLIENNISKEDLYAELSGNWQKIEGSKADEWLLMQPETDLIDDYHLKSIENLETLDLRLIKRIKNKQKQKLALDAIYQKIMETSSK